jgi:DNA-binding transcriptional ArsR family regulator
MYNHMVICLLVTAYAALAEPHRREILDLLRAGERSVNDLVERLRISQPGVSKHLRVLREAGLVEVRPEGRRRWYGLRAEPLAEVDRWLEPYRVYWSGRLDALERHLEENPE